MATRKTTTSYTKGRYRELLWDMIQRHQPTCYFCHQPFVKDVDIPARGVDQLTVHHIDGNHWNDDPQNKALSHRTCHKRHHSKDNINFWRNFK